MRYAASTMARVSSRLARACHALRLPEAMRRNASRLTTAALSAWAAAHVLLPLPGRPRRMVNTVMPRLP